MKRKVRLHKPCLNCGGNIKQEGGGMEALEAQSTAGKCSGSNFGGPNCPKGSPQYNLAVSFRKVTESNKKKIGGDVAEQNKNIDQVGGDRRDTFAGFVSNNATNAVMEQQLLDDYNQMRNPVMQTGGQNMEAFGYNPDNANIDPYLNAYQENQGKLGNATENLFGIAVGAGQLYGDNKGNTTSSIKTTFLPEYRKEGRQWQRDQKRGFKQQEDNAMRDQFSHIKKGMSLEELQFAYGGVPMFDQEGGMYMGEEQYPRMQGGQSVLGQYGEAAGDWFNNLLGRNDPAADAYLANMRSKPTSVQNGQDECGPGEDCFSEDNTTTPQQVTSYDSWIAAGKPKHPWFGTPDEIAGRQGADEGTAEKADKVLSNKGKAKATTPNASTTPAVTNADGTTADAETTEEEVRKGNADPQGETTVDANGNTIFVPHQTLAVNPTGRFGRRGIRDSRFTNRGFGAVAYDPSNTYINDFKYKSGLFGPKVKMSFTHAGIPPWEAEKIQEAAANGDPNAQATVDQVASGAQEFDAGTFDNLQQNNTSYALGPDTAPGDGVAEWMRFSNPEEQEGPISPELAESRRQFNEMEEISALASQLPKREKRGFWNKKQIGGENIDYMDPRDINLNPAQSNRQLITEPNRNVDFMKSELVEKGQPFGGQGAKVGAIGAKVGAEFATSWKNQQEQRKLEQEIQRRTTADNVFTANANPDFGQNTVNPTGVVDPYGVKMAPQFKGFAREGGAQYEQGGEYDLTDSEIEQFLRAGGKIEYID